MSIKPKSADYFPRLWENPPKPTLPQPADDAALVAIMRAATRSKPPSPWPDDAHYVHELGKHFPEREGADLHWHVRRLWPAVLAHWNDDMRQNIYHAQAKVW